MLLRSDSVKSIQGSDAEEGLLVKPKLAKQVTLPRFALTSHRHLGSGDTNRRLVPEDCA